MTLCGKSAFTTPLRAQNLLTTTQNYANRVIVFKMSFCAFKTIFCKLAKTSNS